MSVPSGLVVQDRDGQIHRFPTAKSHRTMALGTHLQTSVHEADCGLGDALAVFNDAVWIMHAGHAPKEEDLGK